MIEKFPFEKIPEPIEILEEERELTPEEIRERLKNPTYLPSREEVFKAFSVKKPEGVDEFEWRFSGEGKKAWLEWHNFCEREGDPVFELWTKEYIEAFSDYLIKRAEDLGGKKEKPILILEVGAGNGKLTHFLREQFEKKKIENIKIIATDSGEWKIKAHFPVEILDYKEALKKYKPDIVISSWMPVYEDWTKDFRNCQSVKEYILIGETDGGCCGHPWETWGVNPEFISPYEIIDKQPKNIREILLEMKKLNEQVDKLEYDKERKEVRKLTEEEEEKLGELLLKKRELRQKLAKERLKEGVPYEKDGFERHDLKEISKYQICRTDKVPEGRAFHSSTVSFRRKVPQEEKVFNII